MMLILQPCGAKEGMFSADPCHQLLCTSTYQAEIVPSVGDHDRHVVLSVVYSLFELQLNRPTGVYTETQALYSVCAAVITQRRQLYKSLIRVNINSCIFELKIMSNCPYITSSLPLLV